MRLLLFFSLSEEVYLFLPTKLGCWGYERLDLLLFIVNHCKAWHRYWGILLRVWCPGDALQLAGLFPNFHVRHLSQLYLRHQGVLIKSLCLCKAALKISLKRLWFIFDLQVNLHRNLIIIIDAILNQIFIYNLQSGLLFSLNLEFWSKFCV